MQCLGGSLDIDISKNITGGPQIAQIFGPQEIVLFGDWFSIKIAIYDIWIYKVPFFSYFWPAFNKELWIFPSIYSTFEQLHYGGLVSKLIFLSFDNEMFSKIKIFCQTWKKFH